MAIKDYREMYISTILTVCKKTNDHKGYDRSTLSKLSFDELKELAQNLQK